MDETTTSVPEEETTAGSSDQGGLEETQAASTTEDTPEETSDETSADPKADASEVTDEDLKWLKSKGIDPTDPKAVAKAYRTAEQEFHKSRQEGKPSLKTQAVTAVTDETDSALTNEVQQLKVAQQVNEFRSNLRDQGYTKDQIDEIDSKMGELVEKKPYLAQDLDALYALARSDKYDSDLKAAEERGRQAAKQSLGKATAAKAPSGNAQTRPESLTKDEEFDKAFKEGWNNPL